ncbi:CAP domain-containing protein [Endogone sp. FLAS-F59071]|nr:CAP domain-containing protein [Endogone sp. FLAS-F59071]|eukprot:RUS12656.1 CAP domain-containing protein [Endogone sp. FLAS-F59071]
MVNLDYLSTVLLGALFLSSLTTASPVVVKKHSKHVSLHRNTKSLSATEKPKKGTWEATVLSRTNYHRRQHGAPPLTWNTTIQAFAQSWVNRCVFRHSRTLLYGENLYVAGQSNTYPKPNGTAPVDNWYNEVQWYNWDEPGNLVGPQGQEIGHFTALVWASSSQVGCAKANCRKGTIWPNYYAQLVSCNYHVPGNVYGPDGDTSYFEENVLERR